LLLSLQFLLLLLLLQAGLVSMPALLLAAPVAGG